MRPTGWILLTTLGASCGGPPELGLVGPFPEDTAWVAAVLLDDSGREVSATGIAPFRREGSSRVTLEEAPDVSEALVYAWSAEALAEILPVDPEVRALPIALRRDGRAPLPQGWQARSQPIGDALVPVSAMERATAPWLPECPTVVPEDQEAVVDIRCAALPCVQSFSQRGCEVPMGLAECSFQDLVARIDGEGEVRIEGDLPGQCQRFEPSTGALASVRCDDCTVDLYLRPRAPLAPLDSEIVALVPPPTAEPRQSPPYHGRLTAMAVTSSAIYAVVLGERSCRAASPTLDVVTVDPLSLEVIERRTLPGCNSAALAVGPDDVPILAAQTPAGAIVTRLGVQRTERMLEGALGPVVAAAVDPLTDRLAVLVGRDDDPRRSRLFLLELEGLRPLPVTPEIDEAKGGLFFTPEGRLFVSRNGFIDVFRALDGSPDGGFEPGTGDGVDNDFHVLVASAGVTAVGVSSNDNSGIHALQGAEATAAGLSYERPLILTSALDVPNPSDPEARGLASGFAFGDGSLEAVVVRFVPDEARFRPRGRVFGGRGPALDLSRDGHGHLWVRMPREGNLRRLRISEL